ncbi:MAG TPA: AtpZ/AtpI family protein [Verrucomicrobiae bacterium]|nr:AtpZ/AtpI family protein [Verrucomicrobiae bacterium]
MAVAMQWVSKITTVSLTMALPALGGWWLDKVCGTAPWLLIVGAMLGMAAAFRQLLQMVATPQPRQKRPGPD